MEPSTWTPSTVDSQRRGLPAPWTPSAVDSQRRGSPAQGMGLQQGDTELTEVPNPPETHARCRVEEQFTDAKRGTEFVDMGAFRTGVHYIEWSEAVYRSAIPGQAAYLPR